MMKITTRDPNRKPTHPGEFVKFDCIEPLGLTATEAAKHLGVTRQALSELISRLGPGDTFVDVGANCGIYSLAAARDDYRFALRLPSRSEAIRRRIALGLDAAARKRETANG